MSRYEFVFMLAESRSPLHMIAWLMRVRPSRLVLKLISSLRGQTLVILWTLLVLRSPAAEVRFSV